jgi:uncharacterized protein YegP (UPF0339 family)
MIVYKQKEYGVLGAGLANLGSGLGAAAGGIVKGAATVGGGLVKAAVPTLTGAGQVAASGLAAGSLGLRAGALWGAAHPLLLGGLGAYALYKILKKRRERKIAERGYSVAEKVFSIKMSDNTRRMIIERQKRLNPGLLERGIKLDRLKKFSEVSDQLDIPMPIPSAPREVVPKKIVKKAQKSGVVQKDADGNWRVINMHGPNGQAIYWKPKYGSKEKAENALKSYQSGAWSKRK